MSLRSDAVIGDEDRREFGEVFVLGIERSTRDRYLMGVCGGIAHSLGWDSTLVRAITILAGVIIPGVSVFLVAVIYVVLGFVLPESRDF